MAWVCVGYNDEELVFNYKPKRKIYEIDFLWDGNNMIAPEWIDSKHTGRITLPKGSIKKLIGRELKWEDEPVELV